MNKIKLNYFIIFLFVIVILAITGKVIAYSTLSDQNISIKIEPIQVEKGQDIKITITPS
jgi:cytochrome b subunit of formate dehydrogenase